MANNVLETDNCPVCNTSCELERGFEKGAFETGLETEEKEIVYATCRTCGTRWRRREEYVGESKKKAVYEKWTYRIPSISLPIPFIGTVFNLSHRWGKWVKVKEKPIPVASLQLPSESVQFKEEIRQVVRDEISKLRTMKEHQQNIILADKEFVVPQNDARTLFFDIDVSCKTNVKIIGGVSVSGGQNNDIKFFALDEHNYRKAVMNLSRQTIDESGQVSRYHFEIPITHSGRYYLVFDNKFSIFSPKTVRITTIESYEFVKFGL